MARQITAFLVSLMITLALVPVVYAQDTSGSLSTPAYVIMSTESGQMLKENNSASSVNAALLHRMMICFLAIENLDTDISANISGQKYSVPDLLKLSLLADNQSATSALSDMLSPVPESIVKMMNRRATELGLSNTLFTVAEQADSEYSHTTLQDMAKFITAAINNSEFKALYCTQATVLSADGTLINNNNKLVMAAGSSKNTGGTLDTYVLDTNERYTISYMGNIICEETGATINIVFVCDCIYGTDYRKFGENIFSEIGNSYTRVPVVTTGETLLALPVGNETLNITAASDAYCIKSSETGNPVTQVSFTMREGYDINDIEPPIIKNSELGMANVLLYDGTTVNVPIVAGNSIYVQNESINNFITSLISNRQILFIIGILSAIEIVLLVLNIKRRLGK